MTVAKFYAEVERQGRACGQGVDPAALPSVAFADRLNLPLCAGVYFVFDSNDDIAYIGKSRNIRGRWSGKQHKVSKQMSNNGSARIAWLEVPQVRSHAGDSSYLKGLEESLIERFKPVLNTGRAQRIGFDLLERICLRLECTPGELLLIDQEVAAKKSKKGGAK